MAALKTRLDLLLDRVTPRHEVTIDADGYTPDQVDRIYATAKARGLHASGTRRWILIRDLSKMHGNARRPQGPPSTVPCACGSHEAYWHGPEDGLREYACDACWRRRKAPRRTRTTHGNASRTRVGIPWVGTDYIERRYYAIQPGLADIYLTGIGRGRGMSTARADEFIERGRVTLGWMMAQNPAPTALGRRRVGAIIDELRGLLSKAMAVRSGRGRPRLVRGDRRRK